MIIADTSFLAAYAVLRDQNHGRAEKLFQEVFGEKHGKVLVPDAVFYEAMTVVFARTKSLKAATDFGKRLLDSSSIVFGEQTLLDSSFEIFSNQRGTKLSFADCMLVALARTLGVEKIATFDSEFKKVPGITVID